MMHRDVEITINYHLFVVFINNTHIYMREKHHISIRIMR